MNNYFNDTRNIFTRHIFTRRIRIGLWSTFLFYFPIPSGKLSCVFNSLSCFLGCSLSFSTESGAITLSKEKYFQSLRNYSLTQFFSTGFGVGGRGWTFCIYFYLASHAFKLLRYLNHLGNKKMYNSFKKTANQRIEYYTDERNMEKAKGM